MSGHDLEQHAREFLALEYEKDGKTGSANHIRTQPLLPNKARAIRAIAAALRQQPAYNPRCGANITQSFVINGTTDRMTLRQMLRLPGSETSRAKYKGGAGAALTATQPAPVVDDAMVERALSAKVGHLSVRQLFACEREARQGARAILTAAQEVQP